MTDAPALSVVLVAKRWETIRRVVSCLREQAAPERIELVVAAPSEAGLGVEAAEADGLAAVRVVETGPDLSLPEARAAAVRAAGAPVVFLGETHVYPHPGFADALLAAHGRGFAAVAPAIGNANPGRALSWAAFLHDYGSRLPGWPSRELTEVQSYNTSFERAVLLEQGDLLAELLAPGVQLSAELRARGHRFLFEPAARADHLNVSRARPWVAERYLGGRILAEARVRRWPARRRLLYAAASPLIPVVSIVRVRRGVPWQALRLPRGTLAALVLGCIVWGGGELAGYLAGGTRAESKMAKYELDKIGYVTPEAR